MFKNYRSIFLIFLCFYLNGDLFSQNINYKQYHNFLLEGKKSTSIKNNINFLKKAINLETPFQEELSSLSFFYFKIGKKNKAKKYFFKSIIHGRQIEKDEDLKNTPFIIDYEMDFLSQNDSSAYSKFLYDLYIKKNKKVNKLRKSYLKKISSYQNQIYESMLQNENYFQSLRFLFYDKKVNDSIAFKYVAKYGSTPNSYYLLDLLKSDKFPERRKCARFNSQTITMLLNHGIAGFLNREDALQFVQLLWEIVVRGDITPYEYACAYDHYVSCFIDENKSYFGTAMCFKDGKLALLDLLNPNLINEIRKTHWLNPLEDFLSDSNLISPSNYGK